MEKALIVVLCLLLFVSCVPPHEDVVDVPVGYNTAQRFVDEEAGVVCWTYIFSAGAGMSCLPINQTRLE